MDPQPEPNNNKYTRGAELLVAWIEKHHYTNEQVARRLRCGHASISRYRRGEVLPHPIVQKQIERLTGGAVYLAAWTERPLDAIENKDHRRNRRKRAVRCRTISIKRMTKRDLEIGRLAFPEDTRPLRPKTRAECVGGPRPCPFVSCKYHLYLDVQARTGAIKLNFPDLEVEEMRESCSLDVADRGGATLEEVGAIMNLTRERVRQLELRAAENVAEARGIEKLAEFAGVTLTPGRRHLPVLRDDYDYAVGVAEPADDDEEGAS